MKNFFISLLVVSLVASLAVNIWYKVHSPVVHNIVDTISIEKIDTIRDSIPQVRIERLTAHIRDTVRLVDSIIGDTSAIVEIPISQKEYSDDSTYTAWISGYKANLDSINVYNRTITKVVKEKKLDKWSIGVGIGIGYDCQHVRPYIGIGLQYNLFGW